MFNQIADLILPQFESLKKDIAGLTNEFRQFSNRIAEVETRVSELEDYKNSQEVQLREYDVKIKTMQSKIEDLEDRSRRNNVRVVGLPETREFDDLIKFASQTLPQLLEMNIQPEGVLVERAHRTGQIKRFSDGYSRPRIVVIRYLNFQDKINILRHFRKLNTLMIGNTRIHLFQDFSIETSTKRKEMAPYCTAIIKAGYRARMRYPAQILVDVDDTTQTFNNASEVKLFFERYKIEFNTTERKNRDTS